MKSNSSRATVFIIFSGMLWGTTGLFVRVLQTYGFTTNDIAVLRLSVAALFFAILMLLRNHALFRISLKDLGLFCVIGLASLLVFCVCYFKAIELLPVSIAVILLYTSPIWVTIMSVVFFKERLSVQKLIALALAFGGCVLVSGVSGGNLSVLGILMGLCSGIAYALYSILCTVALRRSSPLCVTTFSMLIAACGACCFFGFDNIAVVFSEHSLFSCLPLIIALGLVTNLFPYLLYTVGLKDIPASKAAILVTVEPIVATILGTFVLGEALTISTGIGIMLVLMAIVVLNVRLKTHSSLDIQ